MANIEEHYRLNHKLLTKRARNMVPNKCHHLAQDAVQEAYTLVIYYNKFDKQQEFDKYMSSVLRNVCNKMHGQEKMSGSSLEDLGYEDEADYLEEVARAFDISQKHDDARKFLTSKLIILPEGEQNTINMFRNGISITDISIYQGRSRQAVHQAIQKFMRSLI